MPKLTLSVSSSVVETAKSHAKERGLSLSKMVESYLISVAAPTSGTGRVPVTRSLRGSLKTASQVEYREHLVRKYL